MKKESLRQEKYHNSDKLIPQVQVGDKIYYPNRKLSSKAKNYSAGLVKKYLGPVIVKRMISPLVVELQNDTGKSLGAHYIPDLKIPRTSSRLKAKSR